MDDECAPTNCASHAADPRSPPTNAPQAQLLLVRQEEPNTMNGRPLCPCAPAIAASHIAIQSSVTLLISWRWLSGCWTRRGSSSVACSRCARAPAVRRASTCSPTVSQEPLVSSMDASDPFTPPQFREGDGADPLAVFRRVISRQITPIHVRLVLRGSPMAMGPLSPARFDEEDRCPCAKPIHDHCAALVREQATFFDVARCLSRHERELPQTCRDKLDHTVAGACSADLDRFCAGPCPRRARRAHRLSPPSPPLHRRPPRRQPCPPLPCPPRQGAERVLHCLLQGRPLARGHGGS